MNFNIDDKSKEILNLFTKEFKQVNNYMIDKHKKNINKYVPTIFKHWYYSTLSTTECLYSPANILSLSDDKDIIYSYTVNVDELYNFKFKKIAYSLNEHPIITDLKELIKFCSPCAELNYNNLFSSEDINKILSKISNPDIYYVEYLILLAQKLKLIVNLPSINTKKILPATNVDVFFNMKNNKILESIFNASIKISVDKFDFLICDDLNYETIYTFLKKQQSIDEIFSIIYSSIGVNIDSILDKIFSKNFSKYNDFISTTYFIGNIIDRWFLSIFGNYLNIINPIYLEPYDFKSSINTIYNLITIGKDVSTELFSPVSCYTLTHLGEKLIYNNETPKVNIFENLKFDEAYNFITTEINVHSHKKMLNSINSISENTFILKISYLINPKCFVTIEVSKDLTLEDLANEIILSFEIEEISNYSFFIDKPTSVPTYYISSESSKRSFHKAANTDISSIDLMTGDKFIFIPEGNKKNKMSITVEDILIESPYVTYPRIIDKNFESI